MVSTLAITARIPKKMFVIVSEELVDKRSFVVTGPQSLVLLERLSGDIRPKIKVIPASRRTSVD